MKYTTFVIKDEEIITWLKSILPNMIEDLVITDHEEPGRND